MTFAGCEPIALEDVYMCVTGRKHDKCAVKNNVINMLHGLYIIRYVYLFTLALHTAISGVNVHLYWKSGERGPCSVLKSDINSFEGIRWFSITLLSVFLFLAISLLLMHYKRIGEGNKLCLTLSNMEPEQQPKVLFYILICPPAQWLCHPATGTGKGVIIHNKK